MKLCFPLGDKIQSFLYGVTDLPSDSLRKNLAWWAVTRRTSKNHKTVKIWGWALARTIRYKFNTVTYWAALV